MDLVTSIDIIVPLRNEAPYMRNLIPQLLLQTHRPNAILLIVAPSDDDTLNIANEYARDNPHVAVHNNPAGTAPHAMNIGLQHVTADAWIRIDGHTEVPTDLLEILKSEINTQKVACVGPVLHSGSRDDKQAAIGLAMSSPLGVGNARFRTGRGGSGPVDTVAFGLYRRSATERIGGFSTELTRNQDDHFNTRLRQAGEVIWLTDKVHVTYFPRNSYRALASQYGQYGYWRMISTNLHGNQLRIRQIAPAALVTGLATSSYALTRRRARVAGSIIPGFYAAVLTTQAIREVRRGNPSSTALASALAAATMHLSYGIGTIFGFARARTGLHRRSPEISSTAGKDGAP